MNQTAYMVPRLLKHHLHHLPHLHHLDPLRNNQDGQGGVGGVDATRREVDRAAAHSCLKP